MICDNKYNFCDKNIHVSVFFYAQDIIEKKHTNLDYFLHNMQNQLSTISN